MSAPPAAPWAIPLTEPELGDEEVRAVTAVLRSGWLTMGPVTAELERRFAEKLGVRHAIAVGNGTQALHLANLALGIGPGDEVICPALTFVASASATRYTGAEVAFADSRSADDLTLSPEDVAARVTPRTRALTVVHYAGFSCRMDELLAIARRHALGVIEDCAHAPFAHHRSPDGARRALGTLGDLGCFSFYGNKNMTTGEGGMVTTDRDDLAARVRLLRSHGMTSGTYERHTRHASGYDVVALGYNYRLDEVRAALALCQLDRIDRLNARRREVYGWYREAFRGRRVLRVAFRERDLDDSACHILPAAVAGPAGPVRERLERARIQTSKHYDPITAFTLYRERARPLPVVDALELVTLPLSAAMTREQVEQVARVACDDASPRSGPGG